MARLWMALIALTFSSPLWARTIDRDFVFKIFTADIFAYDPYEDSSHPHAMAKNLRDALSKAESSVEMAIYGVRNQNWFEETLKDARSRRINIQAVVDQSAGKRGEWLANNFFYHDTPHLSQILGEDNVLPDISESGTIRTSIMHNKFVVIDRRYVWTGSTNLSDTCIGQEFNANTSVLIDSQELASSFSREFSQMFQQQHFSLSKKHVPVDVLEFADGTRVTSLFSPQHSPIDHAVLPLIEKTRRKLDVAIFFLTEPRVIDALIRAVERGVAVRIIHDGLAAVHPSNQVDRLRAAGIDLRVENWEGKMHMKTAISDGVNVVIGSMNWSKAGNLKNDENTLWIENNRILARDLTAYFDRLWVSLPSANGDEGTRGLVFQSGFHELLRGAIGRKNLKPASLRSASSTDATRPSDDSDP